MTDNRRGTSVAEEGEKVIELTIIQLFFFLKKYFLKLIIIAGIFGILGVLYSFSLPRTYKAQTVLLPEYARMNERSGIFAMSMGMGGREGAENLYPELYNFVLNSRPFGEYLLQQKIVDREGNDYPTLSAFFAKDNAANSGSIIKKIRDLFSFSSEKPQEIRVSSNAPVKVLSIAEDSQIKRASSLITLSVNATNGLITIDSETEDPMVSAIVVDLGRKYLMDYVESYRTEKLSNNIEYLETQLADVKSKQMKASFAYQNFKDRNQNLYLNTTKIEEERLLADYRLFAGLTDQIASQLEQAKLKLKQEKPVFKELEPVVVPNHKSGPKRLLIGIIFAFLGGFLGIVYFLFVKEKVQRLLIFR